MRKGHLRSRGHVSSLRVSSSSEIAIAIDDTCKEATTDSRRQHWLVRYRRSPDDGGVRLRGVFLIRLFYERVDAIWRLHQSWTNAESTAWSDRWCSSIYYWRH